MTICRAWARADINAIQMGAALQGYAGLLGATVDERVVKAKAGCLDVTEDDGSAVFALTSGDAAGLAQLKRVLSSVLTDHGVPWDWMEDLTDRRPGNLSVAEVVAVHRLSPSFTRVVLEGPDLMRFATGGLHFRLLFGPKGADWPGVDDMGQVYWPGGLSAWHRPVYTVRQITSVPGGGQLVFDVFRHAGGRVMAWCDRVRPEAKIALTGPGGGTFSAPVGRIGFVGDETAVPVIARMLEALPVTASGRVILHVPSDADRQPLWHPPGVAVSWRSSASRDPLADLPEVCAGGPTQLFYAGERKAAETARFWMKAQKLTCKPSTAAAYWTAS